MADDHVPIEGRDFRTIGMAWTVRHRDGRRTRYFTLKDFLVAREEGGIVDDDALSSDGVTWMRVGRVEDFHEMFREAWQLGADENASVLQVGLNDSLITDQPSLRLKFVPLDRAVKAPTPAPAPRAAPLSGALASAPPPSLLPPHEGTPEPSAPDKTLPRQATLLALGAAVGIGTAVLVVGFGLLVLFWRGGVWG